MGNRFLGIKTLGDLYMAFNNVDAEYKALTPDELDRIADVFEANIPDKVDMPDRPLTEAGYKLIWNVTIDTVEGYIAEENEAVEEETAATYETINVEDNTMNKENVTIEEEVTMADAAANFAQASKEKLEKGFKYVVENIDVAKEEVQKMADMNSEELDGYLKEKGKSVLDKIIDGIKKYSNEMKANADIFPSFKDHAIKSDGIINDIKAVLDEDNLSGWGKFKAIVKELVKWLLKLLLKVGAIVLKLAFTIAVGAIKIGATTVVTAGKAIGIVNKEVVKPTVNAGKKAWAKHQAKKAYMEEFEEEFFEEFEDDFDDFDDEVVSEQ